MQPGVHFYSRLEIATDKSSDIESLTQKLRQSSCFFKMVEQDLTLRLGAISKKLLILIFVDVFDYIQNF